MRRVGWQAAQHTGQLETVLRAPETVALLQASPQAARILAPLCRMLMMDPNLLRPGAEIEKAVKAPADRKRVRRKRAPIDWGRIPLPRGVLSAARRAGFKPVR